jgi:hypothetical protein
LLWVYAGDADLPLVNPTKVQAAPADTVWILEADSHRIRRIGSSGMVRLAWRENLNAPVCLSMNWKLDEVWLGDVERHRIIRNNKGGEAINWMGGLGAPVSLSIYNPDLDKGE